MESFTRKYRKTRGSKVIRFRTILAIACFLLVLLPILLISLFAGRQSSDIVRQNTQQTLRGLLEQSNQQLQGYVDEVEAVYSTVTLDTNLVDAIRLENTQSTVYERNTHLAYITKSLKNLCNGHAILDNIVLYTPQGNILIASGNTTLPYREGLPAYSWFDVLERGALEQYTNDNFEMTMAQYPYPVKQQVYLNARRIYDYRDMRSLGVLVVTVRTDAFFAAVDRLPIPADSGVALLDREGALMYGRQLTPALQNTLQGDWQAAAGLDEYLAVGSERYFTVSQTLDTLGWQLVSVTPRSYIMGSANAVWAFSWRIAMIVALLCGLLVILLVKKLNQPIGRIADAITAFGEGRLDVRLPEEPYTEFRQVGQQFNCMAAQIDTLITTVRETEQEKQQLNMRMLEAQINPHFIYNTLDAVKWVAVMHGDRESARMITALVKLLRISVYTKSEFITVAEELEYLKNYLMLIELRYGTQIEFVYDVAEQALPCRTLKLVLQPIVENAVFHGLLGKVEHGVVTICYRADDCLCLTVQDNGIGCVSAEPQGKARERFSGIGLDNIDRRIKLWSGDAYGITMESQPGQGTRVTVRQPLQREGGAAC